jgi:antirestriction protein ArdC
MGSAVLSTSRFDVHRVITEKIIAAMEVGAPDCQMPWHRASAGVTRPMNAVTGKPYRGVNVLALWADALLSGYESGYWATYRQWRTAGAQVRKGSTGSVIVFYKREEIPSDKNNRNAREDLEPETRLIARASWVFNSDQVDGWSAPEIPRPDEARVLGQVEAFIAATGAIIQHGGDACCYRPPLDRIDMVERDRFLGSEWSTPTESYYAILLHELVHWTGHATRLARDLCNRFGDEAYAMEELVAELGAAFLCADLGITNEPRLDHAAYIRSWLRVLKQDRKALFAASSKASAAAEYLGEIQVRQDQAPSNFGPKLSG